MRVTFVEFSAHRTGSAISGKMIVGAFLDAGWEVRTLFAHGGPMQGEYLRMGSEVATVSHKSWLRSNNLVRTAKIWMEHWNTGALFAREYREWKPDLVYVNTLVSASAAVAARRQGIPVIWHIRELFSADGGELRVPGPITRGLARRVVRRNAAKAVAISEYTGQKTLGPMDYEVIPNAVPDTFLATSGGGAVLDVEAGVPVIGVPTNLRPVKGIEFLLAALDGLPGDWQCLVTGDGDDAYRRSLVAEIATRGLTERVRLIGSVKDMRQFYRKCDLICIPSRSETFGRTVIESFAMRKPVVATSVGGIPEIVRDGDNGVLVPYGDVHVLRSALSGLLNDEGRRVRLANSAFKDVHVRFSAASYCRRITGLVVDVLAIRR